MFNIRNSYRHSFGFGLFRRHAAKNFRCVSVNYHGRIKKWDILAVVIFLITLIVYAVVGPGSNRTGTGSVTENGGIFENVKAELTKSQGAGGGAEVSDRELAEISGFDVLVLRGTGEVESIPLEQYVAGVVASEMPSSFEPEALKAQVVAARTYVTARRDTYDTGKGKHPGAYVCDSVCCQVYQDEAQLREVKSAEWMEADFNKIKSAVLDTAGQLLYYDGELVTQPLFFSCSGGRTENSEDVFTGTLPYLRSVSSDYDSTTKYTDQPHTFTFEQIETAVSDYEKSHNLITTLAFASPTDIEILARTDGDGVALMRFGALQLTGRQVRELLKLPSSDFTVQVDTDTVTFITQGNGHRVGLSQHGANGMAQKGYTYKDILTHYYSGTTISKPV